MSLSLTNMFNLVIGAMLILASMNFMGHFSIYIFVAFFILILGHKKIKINKVVILLFLLSVFRIIFFDSSKVSILGAVVQLTYPIMYFIGINLYFDKSSDEILPRCLTYIIIGTIVHALLNYFFNLDAFNRYSLKDYWTNEGTVATCEAGLLVFGIGAVPGMLIAGKKVRYIIIGGLILIFSTLYGLMLGGRTYFVIFALTFFACLVYYLLFSNERFSKKKKTVLIILAFIILFFYLICIDFYGIRTKLESSNLFLRFTKDSSDKWYEDGRLEHKIKFFQNFTDSFFGGSNLLKKYGYAHELYLDAYDESGFLVYIVLLIFLIYSVSLIKQILLCEIIKVFDKIIWLGVFVSVNLELFVEPILQGIQWFYPIYCFFIGCMESYYISKINSYKPSSNI